MTCKTALQYLGLRSARPSSLRHQQNGELGRHTIPYRQNNFQTISTFRTELNHMARSQKASLVRWCIATVVTYRKIHDSRYS